MKPNVKFSAVRTLEKTVLEITRADEASGSVLLHGRLVVRLRQRVRRLKRLLQDDPKQVFWEELQKAVLEAAKHLCRR